MFDWPFLVPIIDTLFIITMWKFLLLLPENSSYIDPNFSSVCYGIFKSLTILRPQSYHTNPVVVLVVIINIRITFISIMTKKVVMVMITVDNLWSKVWWTMDNLRCDGPWIIDSVKCIHQIFEVLEIFLWQIGVKCLPYTKCSSMYRSFLIPILSLGVKIRVYWCLLCFDLMSSHNCRFLCLFPHLHFSLFVFTNSPSPVFLVLVYLIYCKSTFSPTNSFCNL